MLIIVLEIVAILLALLLKLVSFVTGIYFFSALGAAAIFIAWATLLPLTAFGMFMGFLGFKQGAAMMIVAGTLTVIGWEIGTPVLQFFVPNIAEHAPDYCDPKTVAHCPGYQL